jgi:type I restriction enzyme S subunit
MITQINGGFAFKSINYVDHNKGIRVLRISDFDENGFRNNKNVYHQYLETLEPYLLEKNDIIMCMTGGTVGKSLLIKSLTEPMLVNQRVATIKLSNGIIPLYAYAFIQSGHIKNIINKSKNSTNDNISMDLLKSLIFPLPPLAEQARIIERLEKLESLIEKYDALEKQATKLDSEIKDKLRKSILQYAIQGKLVPQDKNDEPASMLLEHIRKEKKAHLGKKYVESYIYKGDDNCYYEHVKSDSINIDDQLPFDLPNNWSWSRLRDVVYNHGQKTPKNTFCYIDIGSIDNKNQKLNAIDKIIKPENAPSRARKIVKKGDIIYSTVRPYLHNACIIDRDFLYEPIASSGFAVLSVKPGIYNDFLFKYLLSSSFDSYANNAENSKGVAYPAINDTRLYQAVIPIPPIKEQYRIADKVNKIFSLLGE